MSLSLEYFDEREKRRRDWEQMGYLELETLAQNHGIDETDLLDAGLLEVSLAHRTTDLRDVVVAGKGRRFFKSADYQLILLKPDCLPDLLEILDGRNGGDGEVRSS